MGSSLDRQVTAILAVLRIDDESDRRDRAAITKLGRHPTGLIDARQHLAVPEDTEFAMHLMRRQPVRDTLARTAALERQHQAR